MAARLHERLEVATCIACGARSRVGSCASGCADVALDIVAADEVDAHAERAAALAARVEALRAVVERLAGDDDLDAALAGAAHSALATALPDALPEPEIVPAWGCPECGRVDAPQPCLDVCIRRPVLMADAAEYRAVAARSAELEDKERRLSRLARAVAYAHPRAGHEAEHRAQLQAAARAALGAST